MKLKKFIVFIALFVIWLMYTWPFSPFDAQAFIAGLVAAGIVLIIFPATPRGINSKKLSQPSRYMWAVLYMPVLVWYMLKANLDVLYRVIHPDLPIKPGIVKIKTSLKNPIARAILCNSITLTPGTLSVDIEGDVIYVHWIYVRKRSVDSHTEVIGGRFEDILKKVFE